MAIEDLKHATIKDVLIVSVQLEEKNRKLYQELAARVTDKASKELFLVLSKEEDKHVEIFNLMLGDVTYNLAPDSNDDRMALLLQHFQRKILPPEVMKQKLSELKSLESIFEFAIRIELDHITFYTEIKSHLIKDHQFYINTIIDEERKHFLRLQQMRRSLGL